MALYTSCKLHTHDMRMICLTHEFVSPNKQITFVYYFLFSLYSNFVSNFSGAGSSLFLTLYLLACPKGYGLILDLTHLCLPGSYDHELPKFRFQDKKRS